jgi:hypothetical protein
MKRFTVAVVALSGCILGPACQAIVGIDDRIEAPALDDGGVDGTTNPATGDDAGSTDAATDGPCANEACVEPDAAPPLGCPTGCQSPAPPGWKGPSAVYDDIESTKPAACPSAYPEKEVDAHQGMTAAPATCDCGTATLSDRKCTSTVLTFSDGACTMGQQAIGKVSGCFVTGSDIGIRYQVTTGSLNAGTCSYPNAKTTLPAPAFTKVDVACGRTTIDVCPTKAECVVAPAPEAPYGRLCIYKDGQAACPSLDYAKRFVAFTKITETRACTACSGTASGGACGTNWGNQASSLQCPSISPPTDKVAGAGGCYVYNGAGTVIDTGAMQPSGGTCTTTGGAATGTAVTDTASAVTFCCNN